MSSEHEKRMIRELEQLADDLEAMPKLRAKIERLRAERDECRRLLAEATKAARRAAGGTP